MVKSPDVYESKADESVSETVIRALADAKGVDPVDMDLCLYDTIDPNALDSIFTGTTDGTERRVSFTVDGYRIAVDESQTVFLTEVGNRQTSTYSDRGGPNVLRGAGLPWKLVPSDSLQ